MVRVAIVDDCRDNTDTTGTLLELEGHQVLRLYTAKHLVDELLPFHPDVLVMEMRMYPVTGLQAMKEVRDESQLAAMRAVCVSGLTRPEDRAAALEGGFDYFIAKPFALDPLRIMLNRLMVDRRLCQ